MAYFTAVLAAAPSPVTSPRAWQVVDVDLDDVADVDALADALSDAGDSVDPRALVLAVLEREDEWFALARAGQDGVRLFVSDLEAAGTSRFADLLTDAVTPADDGGREVDDDVDDADDGGDDDEGDDGGGAVALDEDGPLEVDARGADVAGPSWAGDAGLLADVGVAAEELVHTSESNDPATALAVVGERVGFVELLEALR